MTSRTSAWTGCMPKSVTAQVAPARAQACGSSSGGISTITSNESPAGRDSRTSPAYPARAASGAGTSAGTGGDPCSRIRFITRRIPW